MSVRAQSRDLRRKTILAVGAGVILAGIVVSAVFTLGIKALYFFIK